MFTNIHQKLCDTFYHVFGEHFQPLRYLFYTNILITTTPHILSHVSIRPRHTVPKYRIYFSWFLSLYILRVYYLDAIFLVVIRSWFAPIGSNASYNFCKSGKYKKKYFFLSKSEKNVYTRACNKIDDANDFVGCFNQQAARYGPISLFSLFIAYVYTVSNIHSKFVGPNGRYLRVKFRFIFVNFANKERGVVHTQIFASIFMHRT